MQPSPGDLKQVGIFRNATEDDLELVLSNSRMRFIEEDGFFFMQGDPAEHVHVLTSGMVKLVQANPTGQQVNLRTIYPWQLFGALGAVRHGAVYPVTSQALEDSSALAIPAPFVRQILESRPELSQDLMQLMAAYVEEMQARYRELATERVEQRIARVVLRLTAQSGQKEAGGIDLALSRQDLAEMSGTTLYTVSRVLADWDRRGLIVAGRGHVTIKQPHEFVRIAEGL